MAGCEPNLDDYLATGDVPCPMCGYNLRNCKASQCPECGHHLRLISGELDGAETLRNLPLLFGLTAGGIPVLLVSAVLVALFMTALDSYDLAACAVVVVSLPFTVVAAIRVTRHIARSPVVRTAFTDKSSSGGRLMRSYAWIVFYASIISVPFLVPILLSFVQP